MKPRHLITRPLRALMRRAGYEVVRASDWAALLADPSDFSRQDLEDYRVVQPYTQVPRERIYTLARAVEYVVRHNVPGALVECGTFKGGCAMTMARTLLRLGITDRDLYLFDLFADAWPKPTEYDVHEGMSALDMWNAGHETPPEFIYALEDVKANMGTTGYPADRIHYVMGKVEETLPEHAPDEIAVLRLDTDFYVSTRHELVHLYPRLVSGGILIIDDYGDWAGARKAVDEYLADNGIPLFLCRVDVGARMGVKP